MPHFDGSKTYRNYENFPHSHSHDPALLEKFLFRFSKKWIAGYTTEQAISYAKKANDRGLICILNYLGEEITDTEEIKNTVKEYQNLLRYIKLGYIDGCISIKPTQVGLALGYDQCLENLQQILKIAKINDLFVWVDIESFKFVDLTISIYKEILKRNFRAGIVLQSYLRKSNSDLIDLLKYDSHIRIVKGAYKGTNDIAFQSKTEIDENFFTLVKTLFSKTNESNKKDRIMAIATHDSKLIFRTIDLFSKYNFSREILQFQFLKGIRDELKTDLLNRGFQIYEYIPYGNNWLPYSIRRLRERKRNILLLMHSLIS